LKVQVVQTHTGVKLVGGHELASDSDPAWSQCTGSSGTYSREFGYYCGDSRLSPPPDIESRRVDALFYDIQVIMPDAAQVVFHCSTILNTDCQGFPDYPENTSVVCSDFAFGGKAYKDCVARGSSAGGIGIYKAALHGDRVTIFGSHWRRNYLQYGTWHFDRQNPRDLKQAPALATTDPKPSTPPDPQGPKPAAPQDLQDPKSAAPQDLQDPKPAAPQDPKPATPQESPETKPAAAPGEKPATDSTADANAANAADAKVPNPAAVATSATIATDHVIDPHVIEQAKAGDPAAEYTLGYDYYLGRGVPLDYVQAAIWWRKAADQGYPEAQNNLGVLYNSGKGVPQSYAEAYFWQNLAAARANVPLQAQFAKNRDESGSRLWLLSRLKVQQRAAKWAEDHPVPPRSHEPADAKRGEYP
jgi:hypothetical protein